MRKREEQAGVEEVNSKSARKEREREGCRVAR